MIIGGGAAGMMCAIAAADAGHQVTLLEKNEKLGKKVFITGKGRCNIHQRQRCGEPAAAYDAQSTFSVQCLLYF